MEICEKSYCVGCGACAASCPKNCIEMKEDEFGFLYPKVNEELCANCGKCKAVCPVNASVDKSKASAVYACYSNDEKERKSCTSGGAATILSKMVVSSGGVVYGSALTDKGIKHIRIDNALGLEKIKGSKYVQSPIFEILMPLKADLEKERTVLFIGTPCQAAAIRSFLGKPYDNLIVVDLICTGVPPQKMLYENLGISPSDAKKMIFRDETGSRLTAIDDKGGLFYQKPSKEDLFYMGFANKLTFRPSCYLCEFASEDRTSDITLGDFWGLGKTVPFEESQKDGVNCVFLNTSKGEKVFAAAKDKMFAKEREISEAISGNPRYNTCSAAHKNREKFLSLYKTKGFRKAAFRALKKEAVKNAIEQTLRRIKRALKF